MFNNYSRHYKYLQKRHIKFMNSLLIDPYKKEDVKYVIDQLAQDSNVKLIVVFGSTVDGRCHPGSDLDIYVETYNKEKMPIYPKTLSFNALDMVVNMSENELKEHDIGVEGIVVFDREHQYQEFVLDW